MPSAKILEAKKAYVAELNTKIAGSLAGVVVSYNGISVADDTKMRKELREAGVEYMVVKNTMLRRAVAGTQYEALAEYFKGEEPVHHAQPRRPALYAGWLPQRDHRRSGCCDPGDRRQAGRNPRCLIYLAA